MTNDKFQMTNESWKMTNQTNFCIDLDFNGLFGFCHLDFGFIPPPAGLGP